METCTATTTNTTQILKAKVGIIVIKFMMLMHLEFIDNSNNITTNDSVNDNSYNQGNSSNNNTDDEDNCSSESKH